MIVILRHLLLQVAITVVDNGIKIADKINITWGAGYCQINVPENSFPSSQLQSSAYLNLIPVTRTGFILFGSTILFVAILGMKCSNGGWFHFFPQGVGLFISLKKDIFGDLCCMSTCS
jgi:hypothetical protein